YVVYRGTSSGAESYLTTLGDVLTYLDTSVTNGQIYYYQVSAVNSLGEGPRSDEASATPATIPSAPQNLEALSGDSEVTLTWSAPVSNGGAPIAAYRIYRGATSGGESFLIAVGNVLTYVDPSVTNGQTYYYKVSAVNSVGEGPLSAEDSVVPATTPSAPQSLQVTAGNTQTVLTWQAPVSNGGSAVTGYNVYRGLTSGSEVLLITLGNVLTHTDGGLVNGQIYYYRVSAVNAVGEGALSNEASATPVERTTPSAPQDLEALAGDSEVVLSWSAPASDGGVPITTYRIYRGSSSGGEVFLTAVGNVFTYVDASVSNGQTYYYQVSAENSMGEGPKSSEVSATPATIPTVPQNLQSEAGDSYVLLTWIAPVDDGGSDVTNYLVYRGNASSSVALLVTLGNVLSYNDTSVSNGIAYQYRVSAVNSLGEGPSSNQVNATPQIGIVYTVPSAPQDLRAEGGDLQVTLRWAAPVDNGGMTITNYTIYRNTSSGTETYLATVGNVLSYVDLAVTNNVTYYYKVSAVNGIGEGALSDEASSTPSAHMAPSAPQEVVADAGDSYVALTWSAPADDGGSPVTGYNIYRGTNATSLSLLVTVGTVITYNDTSVVNGQVYYYQIAAVNDVGEGSLSTVVSATPSGDEGGDNSMLIFGIVGLLLIVAIIAGVYFWMRRRK
ncbi:MAG: fibronectin type III domain-containing protein, partial [Methanomassiliicoccales archaeon]|nr:fibronectin type III domain-containing protein [Methanomassiliicoccales archaeon]